MAILADTVDGVIGVDTHRDTLAAAAVSPVGGILAQTATGADAAGYQQLLAFADIDVAGDRARRCWAVEGTGSDGAGLTAFLHAHGERVVEVARPKRAARRTGAKTDAVDAVRAARQALSHGQQHQVLPRRRGGREALRVLLTTRRHAISSRVAASNQPRGAHRRRARGAARRAARRDDHRTDRPLCGATGPASQAAGTPDDRPGPAESVPLTEGPSHAAPASGRTRL